MTVAAIFRQLHKRNAEAIVRDGVLIVKPKSALDDKLRDAIRAAKDDIIAQLAAEAAFFDLVVAEFDAIEVPDSLSEAAQGHADGASGHCVLDSPRYYGHRCEAFTVEQFSGYSSATRVMTVCKQEKRGCGICDISYSMWRMSKIEAKEDAIQKRKRSSERSTRDYYSRDRGSE